jgi:hypothetical protein
MEQSFSATEISPRYKLDGGRDGVVYGELCPTASFVHFRTMSADSTIRSREAQPGTCRCCMFMLERRLPTERFTGGSWL